MTSLTFFYQACPVCGRSLRVPVQYFGKVMSCSHCGGEFQAVNEDSRPIASAGESGNPYSESAARISAIAAVEGAT